YEDLVEDPRRELERICGFMGMELNAGDLGAIHDGEARLSFGHLVAGNRMRLESGPVRIRLDEQWRSSLEPRYQRLVTLLTWPLLRRYGYVGPLLSRSRSAEVDYSETDRAMSPLAPHR